MAERTASFPGKWLCAVALFAAFLNILPRIFLPPGGDVLTHYAQIECFARQVWEGHLYPRWCIEANAGLGGSDFLSYFPLPYYATALFYPLKPLIGVEGIYLCGLFVTSAAAFITCTLWLSDVAGRKIALAGAFLLLWLPYRSELLFYRSAYPELCELALLPLLFLWLRRAASGRTAGWPALAVIVALALFTHVPTAIICMAAGSLYLVLLKPSWRTLLKWPVGLALGLAIAAIYAVPAETFLFALNPEGLLRMSHEWPSEFFTLANFQHQGFTALADMMSIAVLFALAAVVLMRQRSIGDDFTRRETVAWCIIAVVFLFLLFSVSAPIWNVVKAVAGVAATPWRVQMVLMFALIYLFSIYGRWLMTPKAATFARGNYALLMGFLMLLSLFVTTMRTENRALLTVMENVHLMGLGRTNQTRWTDPSHGSPDALLAESKKMDKEPRVNMVKGAGTAEIRQWDDDGIVIEAHLKEKSLLRVRQFYFPIWHATIDGTPAQLVPQENSGRMLLPVPAGSHRIALYTSLDESLPRAWPLAEIISLAGALITLLGFLRQRKF